MPLAHWFRNNTSFTKTAQLFRHRFSRSSLGKCNTHFHHHRRREKLPFVFTAAAVCVFSWDDHRMSNDDVRQQVNEMMKMFQRKSPGANESKRMFDFEAASQMEDDEWKRIYDRKDLIIWRRSMVFETKAEDSEDDSEVR